MSKNALRPSDALIDPKIADGGDEGANVGLQRYYISKYLDGVRYFDAPPPPEGAVYVYNPNSYWGGFRLGKEAFTTLEEAQANLAARRAKRIKSLERQLAKLTRPAATEKPL